MNLILSQIINDGEISDIISIIPSSPMKFYDLQDKNDISFELRFKKYIPFELFTNIAEIFDECIDMLRISYIYDSWSTNLDFKSAGSDRFFFGFNDIEFAFAQKNYDILQGAINNQKIAALYFQLTHFILENDFRIDLLSKHFKLPIFTR